MNSPHTTKVLTTTLLLLVLIGTATAEINIQKYQHDVVFEAAEQETRICGCGTTTDYYVLENKGDLPSEYRLILEAQVPWIKQELWVVHLEAGEETLIPITLSPPCGTTGTTSYVVRAESSYGRFRAVDRTVTVQKCETSRVDVATSDNNVFPCKPVSFTVEITNVATYPEEYLLTTSEGSALSEEYVSLEVGEKEVIYGTAQWSCSDFGTKTIGVTATGKTTGSTNTQTTSINIIPDYDFSVSIPGEDNICAQTTTQKPIIITNEGSTENTYTITTDTEWTDLEQETITLVGGETGVVVLSLSPEDEQIEKKYEVTVTITEELTGQTKTARTPAQVNKCFEHEVEVIPSESTACAGEKGFVVRVTNNGVRTEDFTLQAGGELIASFEEEFFTLRAGEHAETLLSVGIPDREGSYVVDVHVSQTPGISSVTSIPIESVDNARCTEITLSSTEETVYYDTETLPLMITNTGVEAATYSVYWEGKVFFIEEKEIFLSPGEQAIIYLLAHNLEELSPGEYTEQFIIENERAAYRHDFKIDLREKGFWKELSEEMESNPCLRITVILLLLLLIVAVIIILLFFKVIDVESQWVVDKRGTIVLVLGILVLLAILLSVVAAIRINPPVVFSEEPVGTNYSALYHEFPQNSLYELDLGVYFIDPDGQRLTYSNSDVENLRIRYKETIAEIKPDWNWGGTQEIIFTATDDEGLSIESPIMTVRVLHIEPIRVAKNLSLYCSFMNWLLIAIILILLAVLAYLFPDREQEYRGGSKVIQNGSMPPTITGTQAEPVIQTGAPTAMVGGDVIRGDKVTVVGKQKKELYVGSSGGKTVHRPECPTVRRIPGNKRKTYKDKESALQDGKTACKLCRAFEE